MDKDFSRQYELTAIQKFTYSDLTSAVAAALAELPAGAIVTGGEIIITTAFNSGTSDSIDIGDGGDPNRYTASPVDGTATGRTALTLTGYQYTVSDDVDITWTGAGAAPTQGAGMVIIKYVRPGRAQEVAE